MTINILAFGIARDILGSSLMNLQVNEAVTSDGLKAELEQQFPGLKNISSFMIAINNEYAQPGQIILPGDEIAIIPPVSGG